LRLFAQLPVSAATDWLMSYTLPVIYVNAMRTPIIIGLPRMINIDITFDESCFYKKVSRGKGLNALTTDEVAHRLLNLATTRSMDRA
jgi:hypothetical protein